MAAHGIPSPPTLSSAGEPVPALVDVALKLEHMQSLDRLVDRISHAAALVVKDKKVADLLHGKFMGHAAHPLLTDVPIGTWTSAFLLDVVGGKKSRPAARRLVGTGILAALPTAVTGLAEFAATNDQAARRVGVVHAAGNNVALLLYVLSYRARRRGRHGLGFVTGLAGLSVVSASGFLGAHLSLARKVATRDPVFADQVPLGGDALPVPGEPGEPGSTTARHREESSPGSGTML
jgi:uncharacterized membrane protein